MNPAALASLIALIAAAERNARDWRRRGLDGRAQDQEQMAARLREVVALAEAA